MAPWARDGAFLAKHPHYTRNQMAGIIGLAILTRHALSPPTVEPDL
jgi:hypothetical protein